MFSNRVWHLSPVVGTCPQICTAYAALCNYSTKILTSHQRRNVQLEEGSYSHSSLSLSGSLSITFPYLLLHLPHELTHTTPLNSPPDIVLFPDRTVQWRASTAIALPGRATSRLPSLRASRDRLAAAARCLLPYLHRRHRPPGPRRRDFPRAGMGHRRLSPRHRHRAPSHRTNGTLRRTRSSARRPS